MGYEVLQHKTQLAEMQTSLQLLERRFSKVQSRVLLASEQLRVLRKDSADIKSMTAGTLDNHSQSIAEVREQTSTLREITSSLQDVVVRQVQVNHSHIVASADGVSINLSDAKNECMLVWGLVRLHCFRLSQILALAQLPGHCDCVIEAAIEDTMYSASQVMGPPIKTLTQRVRSLESAQAKATSTIVKSPFASEGAGCAQASDCSATEQNSTSTSPTPADVAAHERSQGSNKTLGAHLKPAPIKSNVAETPNQLDRPSGMSGAGDAPSALPRTQHLPRVCQMGGMQWQHGFRQWVVGSQRRNIASFCHRETRGNAASTCGCNSSHTARSSGVNQSDTLFNVHYA